MSIRKILILGHSGFIGQSLIASLSAKNAEAEIIGYSMSDFDCEVPENWSHIIEHLSEETAVVFLAAVKRQEGDNLKTFARNMSMVANLAAAVGANPVGKLVFYSSGAVYGEDVQHPMITEETLVQPTSYYGIYKYSSERILLKECPSGTLVCLRPPTAYGGGDLPQYGPSGFVYKSIANETITLWGDGEEKREFIYIDDLVELTRRIIFNEFSGTLNICSGVSYTFQDVLKAVGNLPTGLPEINARHRSKDKVDHHFDNALLQQVFPDFTFTPLCDGINKTYESMSRKK